MSKNCIDLVIVDAIRMIVEASEGKVTYDVFSNVDDPPLFGKKNALKKTIVKIVITNQI